MSNTTLEELKFLQRRVSAIQTDIEDITLMYLNAVSTKNMLLAEQCEQSLLKAKEYLSTTQDVIKAYLRPVARGFNN
jgi:hypothetical protein